MLRGCYLYSWCYHNILDRGSTKHGMQVGSVGLPEAETMRVIFPDPSQAQPPEFMPLQNGAVQVDALTLLLIMAANILDFGQLSMHRSNPCRACLCQGLSLQDAGSYPRLLKLAESRVSDRVAKLWCRRFQIRLGRLMPTFPTATLCPRVAARIRSSCTAGRRICRSSATLHRSPTMCSTGPIFLLLDCYFLEVDVLCSGAHICLLHIAVVQRCSCYLMHDLFSKGTHCTSLSVLPHASCATAVM